MAKMLFFASAWEDGEYIISWRSEDAKRWEDLPIGHTLDRADAKVIAAWLNEGGALGIAKCMTMTGNEATHDND